MALKLGANYPVNKGAGTGIINLVLRSDGSRTASVALNVHSDDPSVGFVGNTSRALRVPLDPKHGMAILAAASRECGDTPAKS